jgi:carbon storage regulator
MLILSRNRDEQITIDGGIVITVLEVVGGRVKIGVEAPKETKVIRNELLGYPPKNAGRDEPKRR